MILSSSVAVRSLFQSLLSWIRLLGSLAEILRRVLAGSFNPCCLGSGCSATSRPGPDDDVVSILVVLDQAARLAVVAVAWKVERLFQSLLSWIRLLGSNARNGEWHMAKFQSLLSWIRLLGPGTAAGPAVDFRFQSLLSWIRLLGSTPFAINGPERVSILVVLDQAARLAAAVIGRPLTRRFNPCCLGSGCSARMSFSGRM